MCVVTAGADLHMNIYRSNQLCLENFKLDCTARMPDSKISVSIVPRSYMVSVIYAVPNGAGVGWIWLIERLGSFALQLVVE